MVTPNSISSLIHVTSFDCLRVGATPPEYQQTIGCVCLTEVRLKDQQASMVVTQ